MKVNKKIRVVALALLINGFGTANVAISQELDTLTSETCSVEFTNQLVEEGQSTIDALIQSIELMPECTKTFIDYAVSNNSAAAVRLTLAVINARPDLITDIVVAAVQALPDQKHSILGAVLDTIDDLSTRIDLIYAANDLLQTTDDDSIAELEEVDEEPEDIAELEEAPAPTPPPPPLPTFNPGANDKPTGISPT